MARRTSISRPALSANGASRVYAISWHQENLCEKMIAQPGCPSAWKTLTIAYAARVTPGADIRRLERAFRLIQLRHDALRMNFVQVAGKWRAVLHPDARATLRVTDIGPQDAASRQAELNRRFGQGFAADAPPVSLDLLRCGPDGDLVLLQISHLVTDGFGANLIIKDLMSALIGVPFGAEPLRYDAFQAAFVTRPRAELEAGRHYWATLIKPPEPVPIGLEKTGERVTDRYANERPYRRLVSTLTESQTKTVQAQARRIGCTPFVLLSSGFFEAVHSVSGALALDFGTMLGRSDARLERWSGQAVTNLHAVCRLEDGADLAARAAALQHQIRTSMQHLPHPAVQPQHELMQAYIAGGGIPGRFRIRLPEYVPRASKSSIFAAAFRGGQAARFGRYSLETLHVGAVAALSELTLSQAIAEGRMKISVVYDAGGYSEEEIGVLSDRTTAAMIGGTGR